MGFEVEVVGTCLQEGVLFLQAPHCILHPIGCSVCVRERARKRGRERVGVLSLSLALSLSLFLSVGLSVCLCLCLCICLCLCLCLYLCLCLCLLCCFFLILCRCIVGAVPPSLWRSVSDYLCLSLSLSPCLSTSPYRYMLGVARLR